LGYVFASFRTPIGWVLFAVVPSLVYASFALRRIWSSNGLAPRVALSDA
jgi:hypothetical protein